MNIVIPILYEFQSSLKHKIRCVGRMSELLFTFKESRWLQQGQRKPLQYFFFQSSHLQ